MIRHEPEASTIRNTVYLSIFDIYWKRVYQAMHTDTSNLYCMSYASGYGGSFSETFEVNNIHVDGFVRTVCWDISCLIFVQISAQKNITFQFRVKDIAQVRKCNCKNQNLQHLRIGYWSNMQTQNQWIKLIYIAWICFIDCILMKLRLQQEKEVFIKIAIHQIEEYRCVH